MPQQQQKGSQSQSAERPVAVASRAGAIPRRTISVAGQRSGGRIPKCRQIKGQRRAAHCKSPARPSDVNPGNPERAGDAGRQLAGPLAGKQPQAIDNPAGAAEPQYDQYEVNQPQNMHQASGEEADARAAARPPSRKVRSAASAMVPMAMRKWPMPPMRARRTRTMKSKHRALALTERPARPSTTTAEAYRLSICLKLRLVENGSELDITVWDAGRVGLVDEILSFSSRIVTALYAGSSSIRRGHR